MGRRLPPGQKEQDPNPKQKKLKTKTKKMASKKKIHNNRNSNADDGRKGTGPRLPESLRRELHLLEKEKEEEAMEAHPSSDVYEYEEDEAPEDSCKNRRFDDVERLEYELPSDFEDEDIDETAADGKEIGNWNRNRPIGRKGERKDQQKRRKGVNSEDDKLSDEESTEEVDSDDDDDLDVGDDSEKETDMFCQGEIKADANHEDDSDEELDSDDIDGGYGDGDGDDDDDLDHERHQKMVQAIRKTSNDKNQRKKMDHVELLSEAFPESEFNINPTPNASDGQGLITVEDLIAPLQGTTGFGSLRKRMHQLDKKGSIVNAPLSKAVQERVDRKAGYEQTSEEVSKWQEIVKTNREAPTLVFTQRPELSATSTAELVSKFEPCTDLEKQVASLLQENGFATSALEQENELGFNKVSVNEVKERQQRLAKMRSALFYHEAKAKRMKKIKSKAFHRLLQKGQRSQASGENEFDSESMKEEALKAEFKRAQERMTLKHKNTSKWAKRIIQRGLKAKDDGTREAIAEQLRAHTSLTRKMHSTDIASSSDDSSDDEDAALDAIEASDPSKQKTKLLAKTKMETLKVLEGDAEAEIPTSGLFSLPFMARAIEKKRQEAANEAVAVLEQLERLEYDDEDPSGGFEFQETLEVNRSSGRLSFGAMAKLTPHGNDQEPEMLIEGDSSSDESKVQKVHSLVPTNRNTLQHRKTKLDRNGVKPGCNTLPLVVPQEQSIKFTEESNGVHNEFEVGGLTNVLDRPWLFGKENEGSLSNDLHLLTSTRKENITSVGIESVAIAGDMSSRKRGRQEKQVEKAHTESINVDVVSVGKPGKYQSNNSNSNEDEDEDEDEVMDEEEFRPLTGNASQAELIHRAFAGDDVEADFEQLKSRALNEEVPMGEAHPDLPGWGQWTNVQKKKGPPAWILKEQEELRRKRDEALKKRKDFKLKHVIISEKMDKKAEKFLAPSVPFPFKSRELFEKSIRMPLGREFNTDEAFRDMIRPAVVKDAGVIIDPIKYKMSEAKTGNTSPVADEGRKSKKTRLSKGNQPRVRA